MIKHQLTSLLKAAGLYKPARKIYNLLGRYNKHTEIEYNDHRIKFKTPTFYLDSYVKNLAGEKTILNELMIRLNSSDVFWDVGANVGLYSMVISKNKPNVKKIYSFEPEPAAYKLLQENIKINNITNVTPINAALGNSEGEKTIYSSDTPNFGAHSFVQRTDYKLKKHGQVVNVLIADNVIEKCKVDAPSALKIDVEGAEILVLEGMQDLLKNPALKLILCEVHNNLLPLFGSTGNAVIDLVKSHGFQIDYCSTRKEQNHIIFTR